MSLQWCCCFYEGYSCLSSQIDAGAFNWDFTIRETHIYLNAKLGVMRTLGRNLNHMGLCFDCLYNHLLPNIIIISDRASIMGSGACAVLISTHLPSQSHCLHEHDTTDTCINSCLELLHTRTCVHCTDHVG